MSVTKPERRCTQWFASSAGDAHHRMHMPGQYITPLVAAWMMLQYKRALDNGLTVPLDTSIHAVLTVCPVMVPGADLNIESLVLVQESA